LRQQLRKLESLPPSISFHTIAETLTRELGPLDQLGVEVLPPALAEASVAVVMPFQQNATRQQQPLQGVFKVLKPGIEERLELELGLLERVGSHLDQRCEELRIPHLDYEESFQYVRDKLQDEIRLDQEQQHIDQARAFYANEPRVQIPALFDYCTSRVTAMERVMGGKVTDHNLKIAGDRHRLAQLVVEALIAQPIFAAGQRAMFHCDPHAGNLFLTTDGRLAILDWSLVGSLGEQERVAIVQIMLGALSLDAQRIVAVLEGIAERQHVDRTILTSIVQERLRCLRHGQFPGLTWLVSMLDEAVQTARLRFGADLMLFRKSLHSLEGVVADVGAQSSQIDRVVLTEFLRHFAREWPQRWFAMPDSRRFATRLSNLDLTQLLLGCPATVARFWYEQSLDILHGVRPNC
jgi:ubiquinone biosynthesis protein